MELIDKASLDNTLLKLEMLARNRVIDTPTMIDGHYNPSYTRYTTQLNERTEMRHIVDDAPTVKAIPLDRIKKAREEIEQLKHEHTEVEGYRWWNNAIENCLHELDELIESET